MKRRNHLRPSDMLHGQRVSLKPPLIDDLSFIRTLWSDLETMTAVGGPVDFPEDRARAWFARMVDPGRPANCYCLIFNEESVPVGEISFHHWDPEERSASLNVKVLASHRGLGYGKDALLTFLTFFFGRVGGRVMTDDVAIDNQAGQHVLSSFGFVKHDTVSDVYRMAMTRDMYVTRYGEPTKSLEAIRKSRAPQS